MNNTAGTSAVSLEAVMAWPQQWPHSAIKFKPHAAPPGANCQVGITAVAEAGGVAEGRASAGGG